MTDLAIECDLPQPLAGVPGGASDVSLGHTRSEGAEDRSVEHCPRLVGELLGSPMVGGSLGQLVHDSQHSTLANMVDRQSGLAYDVGMIMMPADALTITLPSGAERPARVLSVNEYSILLSTSHKGMEYGSEVTHRMFYMVAHRFVADGRAALSDLVCFGETDPRVRYDD